MGWPSPSPTGRLGKKCTVFLPENPVQEKADAIEEYGATIVKYGKFHNEREEKAR